MSDEVKVLLTIEDNDDWIQETKNIPHHEVLLMLQSDEVFFPDYFDIKEEKYKPYVIKESKFYFSKHQEEKEFQIEFIYKK
ncbi:hypothetical protein J7E38_14185 [Bacillus sp. ISL-35]|uniref:hypothetical protein n=1 Tax=Bacillus sp. ISL-35 TaxID=2819122 RepID=UPI001BEC29C3|nr:hypothetical protein [Bacillus sp. ISL-35]MBT2680160.1 hypothetical protein [Bacillus sp. ISL-35]MBT2704434.1 hypothetical protein [Chryseobacterium sp. ISL-80]